MIGMIRRLQEKGQAQQQQTDSLVDFIQDELTIDAMKKIAPILPVKENMQLAEGAMGMGAMQNFAPITQSDASVLQNLMDENIIKSQRALEERQAETPNTMGRAPQQGLNTSTLESIRNFAPMSQSDNKAMEMIRKNQTMNPTILKARGM